jgi:hypothetical protein
VTLQAMTNVRYALQRWWHIMSEPGEHCPALAHRVLTLSMLACVLGAVVAACSSVQVESTHNPSFDFSALRTYEWLRPEAAAPDGGKTFGWRVREAVETQLQKRGLTPATSGAPDVLVNYVVQRRRTQEVRGLPLSHSADTELGPTGAIDPYAVEREEGALVLSMIDPTTHKQVWRASAHIRIAAGTDPEALTRQVNDLVQRLFRAYPGS